MKDRKFNFMKKIGDRKDGTLIRKIDAMHFICPIIYPNRCDNEAFISEIIDLTKTIEYLKKKNENESEYQYKLFQIIVTAIMKTIYQRDKMNRFIVNGNTYQRNELSASFVVKKIFSDNGGEALAVIKGNNDDNINTIHNKIFDIVSQSRSEKIDGSTNSMNIFNKMPRFVSKALIKCIMILDKHGLVPQSLISSDPYYTSVVLTNLGSIKLQGGYHHLTNWGTTSIFVIIGQQKKRLFVNEDGTTSVKESIDIGLTIDERIADGYYYSKTVKLFKTLVENPELLEKNFDEKIDLDLFK